MPGNPTYKRLIAIDPSLTCSGWAIFGIKSQKLLGVGKIRSLSCGNSLALRMSDLQAKINNLLERFEVGSKDILICEGPTTMRDPNAAIKVEQVRGLFEAVARQRGVLVPGRINPRSVQREVMGFSGKQQTRTLVKATAVHFLKTLYSSDLEAIKFPCDERSLKRHQDIVDAVLVGNLGLARVHSAERAGMDLMTVLESSSRYQRGRYGKNGGT